MTPISLLHELDNFLTLLHQSEIAKSTTSNVVKRGPAGFQRITWATNTAVPGSLFRHKSATVAEYREWLDWQGYSAVLFDGSFIQMSYDFDYSGLIGHRLLYFPCPFDVDMALLEVLTLTEVIEHYQDLEVAEVKLRSPVRFDFELGSTAPGHPASHMTFQWSYSRVPVTGPVSPGHFIQFVFRNFYPNMWNAHAFIRDWPRYRFERTITPEELDLLHMNTFALQDLQ